MRVYLVDQQPIFREGLKTIFTTERDLTVVGEADTCHGMVEAPNNADLLILDGELNSMVLLNLLQKSKPRGRPPFVLVMAQHDEKHHAIQMLKAGADGYVYKSDPPTTVLAAIRKIAVGGKYVPSEIAEMMIFAMNGVNEPSKLSSREYQVLHLLASGMTTTEIAGHLALSVKTVSTYRSRLLEKLDLKSNAGLIRYAFKKGMLD